jgi:hypothetical protein
MIWIFADSVTERLLYTLDFIFTQRGLSYQVTNDPRYFMSLEVPCKWAYSDYPFDASIPGVSPANLVFEEHIAPQDLTKSVWNNQEVLAFSTKPDPVASIFYVLTRYEEYLDFVPDNHGRFTAKQAIHYKFGWFKQAICDRWAECVLSWLEERSNWQFSDVSKNADLCVTFDIDNTYAYLYKSEVQRYGGQIKDFIKGNQSGLEERKAVLSGQHKDPFDTFEEIEQLADRGVSVKCFWLLGDLKKLDRNVPWDNPHHQRLIRRLAEKMEIGIHPSYFSSQYPHKIAEERGRLEYILHRPVRASRQHFLRVSFPSTFEELLKIKIFEDYTIGFGDVSGFRMGTARRVPFYHLEKDECTELMLTPFLYMEGTLQVHEGFSIARAKTEVTALADEVKRYGGTFYCLWHNDTIADRGQWKGWKDLLYQTIIQFHPDFTF